MKNDRSNNTRIEKHPFTPFLPEGAKVVLCGTFPPKQDKWAMDFFYPNFQNDMWRVFGLLFYGERERFFDKSTKTIRKAAIQEMLTQYRVGIGETATEAVRLKDNASDKFLEIVTPVNLPALLEKVPECRVVATTGEKAASVIASLTGTPVPKMGEYETCRVPISEDEERTILHWRLPSTSRAFPMSLEKKAGYYGEMFRSLGILPG